MPNCPTIIDNAVQVKWLWTLGNISAVNVTHASIAGGFTFSSATAQALFAAIAGNMGTSGLVGTWGTGVSFDKVTIRDMRTPNNAEIESTGAPLTATGSGDLLPPQVAAVLTLRTAKAGKSFRGRIFLPGFAEDANDGQGRIIIDVINVLTLFAAALPSNYSGSGAQLAVASRQVVDRSAGGGCAVIKPSNITPVTQVVIRDNRWDTQRRRTQ